MWSNFFVLCSWQKTWFILLLLYCLGFPSQILGCGNATPNNGQGLALLHSIWSLLCKKELSNNCMKKCHTWSEWKKSAYGHTIHCSPHMGGHYFSQKNRGMIFSCCDGEFLRPSQNRTAIPSRLWFFGSLQGRTHRLSRLLQQPKDQDKTKGPGICSAQILDPSGRLIYNFV